MPTYHHLQESNLITSITSSGSATPFKKMMLFLDLQIDHTVTSQIKEKPCLRFLDPAAPVKHSKSIERFGGKIITKPSHRKIAFHTLSAKSQNKNKCVTVSSIP
jgi:hypothetical protein